MRRHLATLLCISLWLGVSAARLPEALAAWVPDGLPVSPTGTNYKPSIVSDGSGGSIIAWHGEAGTDIFARRLMADGSVAPGWPAGTPLTVCAAAGLQEYPVLVSDLAGGALLFWQDARNGSNYDIFGQHLDASGQVVSTASSNWVAGGNAISTAPDNQYLPQAISDGSGGAIIVWQDGRHGAGNYDIYSQHVDGDGNLLWPPGGNPVCVATNNQINPTIVSDGAHGAYIAWQDYRKGNEYDIYAQHIAADGGIYPDPKWIADGVGACVATNSQFNPVVAADGAGGVFVAWQDYRSGTDNHIFAQHLTAQGAVVTSWPADGRPVCQAQFSQYYPVIANDGSTGAFVTWQDYRSGTSNDIYAQHLTASTTSWAGDGVAISTATNGQFSPQVVPDGAGGAFISWYDSRGGSSNDIYVQQVSGRGTLNPAWDKDGQAVCLAPQTQQFPTIASGGTGTAIITWQDLRTGTVTTGAIYAQSELGNSLAGVASSPAPEARVSAARPNPFRASSQFQLTLPAPAVVRAEVLDITGRRVMTLASRSYPAGIHTLAWDGTNLRGGRAAPGVYLVRVQWAGFDKTLRVVRLP